MTSRLAQKSYPTFPDRGLLGANRELADTEAVFLNHRTGLVVADVNIVGDIEAITLTERAQSKNASWAGPFRM